MKTLLDLRGIVTVLNTPFTTSNEIDLDGLCRNVDAAIRAGVTGFLVPAMASEVDTLSPDERARIVAQVVIATRGRAMVIGGASAQEPGMRLALARQCIDLGCDGVLASLPFQSDAQYEADVRALADLVPGFLMLQDWDATGPGLPAPLLARLFEEVDAFRALKIEVVPAGAKYSTMLALTQGRLHVSGGWAVMHMLEALDRGVHAFMPTGLHAVYARIHALHAAGRRNDARALFHRLLPVLVFSNQDLNTSIRFFKQLLHRQGIYATDHIRVKAPPFDIFQQRVADELIEHALTLTDALDA